MTQIEMVVLPRACLIADLCSVLCYDLCVFGKTNTGPSLQFNCSGFDLFVAKQFCLT